MRVLIPTNNKGFAPALVAAYEARGWEVTTGTDALFACTGEYDLVHLQWPEELARWGTPDRAKLDRIASSLGWWRERTTLLATVHNLLPHQREASEPDRKLYELVYGAAHAIAHFSRHSLESITQAFPDIEADKHIVHRPFLYDLKAGLPERDAARAELGIREGEFALLAFGRFRIAEELSLLQKGVAGAEVPEKRLVFAAHFPRARLFRRLLRRWRLKRWCRRQDAISFGGEGIPEERIASLLTAADAFIIPRLPPHLNSGLLILAMTFGTPVIAPDYGMYREYLEGTRNELYAPGDAQALSRAIERMARKPSPALRAANSELAAGWGWPAALDEILPRLFPPAQFQTAQGPAAA